MSEKNPALEKNLSFREKLRLYWDKTQDYRFGFLLGCLSLGATLFLIFSGRRSEVRSFKTQEPLVQQEANEPQVLASSSASKNEAVKPSINSYNELTQENFSFNKKVNVNKDPIGVLVSLPKIGPVIAGRIVEYREKNGPFKALADLDKVKGIGQKTLATLKDLIEF